MTAQEFPIYKGSVKFEQDQIIINDSAASNRTLMLILAGLWTISGISKIYSYTKSSDRFDLVFGILFLVLQVAIIIIYTRRSVAKSINNNDVDSIQVRKELGSKYLHIKLKNGKVRRVDNLGAGASAIEAFVKNEFNTGVVARQSAHQ